MSNFHHELQIARLAARSAATNALRIQSRGVEAETKSDLSPVTIADKEGEQIIASLIDLHFPDDGILGEEGAERSSKSGRRWIIDPIDGTRDFVRGNMLWCVLIGLEAPTGASGADPEVKVGVAHFPVLDRTYFAIRGGGAFLNDSPIRASTISTFDQSVLMVNIGNKIAHRPDSAKWLEFLGRFWAFRCLGGALDAMMAASGESEVWIEPAAQSWDFAPMQVIAEEAGARFLNFDGDRSIHKRSGMICAPGVEAGVRAFLNSL